MKNIKLPRKHSKTEIPSETTNERTSSWLDGVPVIPWLRSFEA